MSIIAKRLSAKKLKASSQVGAQGDIVKGVRYNGQAHYPENDGLINMDTLVQRIDVNGQDVSPDPDGTFPLEDHTGPIKINSEPHFEPIAPSSLNDLGIITRKINLNGTDISPAPTTGITNLGNVAKSYTINGTKTNIGTGGDVSIGNVVQSVNGSTGAITGIATYKAGGTVSLTWQDVADGKVKGCLGDVNTSGPTLNITGTALAQTYVINPRCTCVSGLTINFVNDATAACNQLTFQEFSAPYVIINNPRAQYLLINNTWGVMQTRIANAVVPTLTAKRNFFEVINGGLVYIQGTTWPTTAPFVADYLYLSRYGSRLMTGGNNENTVPAAVYVNAVALTEMGSADLGSAPVNQTWYSRNASYFKIAGRFVYPSTF
jgi:hypothetical protein